MREQSPWWKTTTRLTRLFRDLCGGLFANLAPETRSFRSDEVIVFHSLTVAMIRFRALSADQKLSRNWKISAASSTGLKRIHVSQTVGNNIPFHRSVSPVMLSRVESLRGRLGASEPEPITLRFCKRYAASFPRGPVAVFLGKPA